MRELVKGGCSSTPLFATVMEPLLTAAATRPTYHATNMRFEDIVLLCGNHHHHACQTYRQREARMLKHNAHHHDTPTLKSPNSRRSMRTGRALSPHEDKPP